MKTNLIIALWLAATCSTSASDPARFWAAAKPARRSAWVVTEQGTPIAPAASAPAAKSCPCSPECVCGCNQGKPCTCGHAAGAAEVPPANFPPSFVPAEGVRWDRLPAQQFNNWYPGVRSGFSRSSGC